MWSPHGPDGTVAAGWYLLPLRLFLGVTFLYAGLQKLANPDFLRNSSPISIHAQLVGAARSSPIHGLLTHLVSIAPGVGVVIALGEVAIGLGVLVGLWMRVAAVAGMALSFGLFLTISYHSSPYFTGSDIVFLFAWTPLALAGAAGAPALDTWFAARPDDQADITTTAPSGAMSRRAVVSKAAVTGIVAVGVLAVSGITAALGRAAGGTKTTVADGEARLGGGTVPTTTATSPTTTAAGGGTTTTTTGSTPSEPSGTAVGSASDVPVGGSAAFTDPATGDPSLVIQQEADHFVAFDAVCPHAGCTVAYVRSAKLIACPCHGSEFDAETGALIQGPATRGLTPISIIKGANGQLYVPK
jgi:thiosulfate dehydrogenase [quinone] large subunit